MARTITVTLADETHRALVERAHSELRAPRMEARRLLEVALAPGRAGSTAQAGVRSVPSAPRRSDMTTR